MTGLLEDRQVSLLLSLVNDEQTSPPAVVSALQSQLVIPVWSVGTTQAFHNMIFNFSSECWQKKVLLMGHKLLQKLSCGRVHNVLDIFCVVTLVLNLILLQRLRTRFLHFIKQRLWQTVSSDRVHYVLHILFVAALVLGFIIFLETLFYSEDKGTRHDIMTNSFPGSIWGPCNCTSVPLELTIL